MTPKVFLLLAALPLLAACSHIGQAKQTFSEEDTLRTISEQKDLALQWTDDLESDRLTMKIDSTEGVEKRVVLSPLAVLAGSEEKNVFPIYPALDGLGSLDTSLFPAPARAVLEQFCQNLIEGRNNASLMAPNSLYLLSLFYYDLEALLQPLRPKGETAAQEEAAQETAEPQSDFTASRYGSPFLSTEFLQVPVQFTGQYGKLSVFVFLIKADDSWKIDQIQIRNWEAGADGKE